MYSESVRDDPSASRPWGYYAIPPATTSDVPVI